MLPHAAGTNTERGNLNTSLRGDSTHFDGLVDIGDNATIVSGGVMVNPTYSSDGLHQNEAANTIWAAAAKPVLLAAMP